MRVQKAVAEVAKMAIEFPMEAQAPLSLDAVTAKADEAIKAREGQ